MINGMYIKTGIKDMEGEEQVLETYWGADRGVSDQARHLQQELQKMLKELQKEHPDQEAEG